MERLLAMAMDAAEQAEVFYLESESTGLGMRNGTVTEVSSSMNSGYALRIIRGGRLGSAYTQNLNDRAELVSNAVASLEGGVEVSFRFPGPSGMPDLDTYRPSVEKLGYGDLADACSDLLSAARGRTDGQIDAGAGMERSLTRIVNSSGLDVSSRRSVFSAGMHILFPNTETSVGESFTALEKAPADPALVAEVLDLYTRGLPEVDAPTGRMKVLFHPSTLYTLLWRMRAAASAKTIFQGTSPLQGRIGERIVSDRISLFDDPHRVGDHAAAAFDDEGVATRRFEIFDRGVFRSAFTNLDYAARLGMEPTGSGQRAGQAISSQPVPDPVLPALATGDARFAGMIDSIDEGVLLLGVLGAHSGNILNGDFSVGMNPGLLVRNGRIEGRVRDGMVAGNVWDVLQRVVSVEDRIHNPRGWSRYPSLLLDGVSVSAGKG